MKKHLVGILIITSLFLINSCSTMNTGGEKSTPESTILKLLNSDPTGDEFWQILGTSSVEDMLSNSELVGILGASLLWVEDGVDNKDISVRYSRTNEGMAEVTWGRYIFVLGAN